MTGAPSSDEAQDELDDDRPHDQEQQAVHPPLELVEAALDAEQPLLEQRLEGAARKQVRASLPR